MIVTDFTISIIVSWARALGARVGAVITMRELSILVTSALWLTTSVNIEVVILGITFDTIWGLKG